MVHKVAKPQKLMFDLMEEGSFNNFNGKKVVKLFNDNANLWSAVYFTQDAGEYITLRDLPNYVNMSTAYIRPRAGMEDQLMGFVKANFRADEVDWVDPETVGSSARLGSSQKKVLRVWWD